MINQYKCLFKVGDLLRFIEHGAKPNLYCIVVQMFDAYNAEVYWIKPAGNQEPFMQSVNLQKSWSGIYEKASQ
jgi:hypothetical protein